jgi:hypothetical protein
MVYFKAFSLSLSKQESCQQTKTNLKNFERENMALYTPLVLCGPPPPVFS